MKEPDELKEDPGNPVFADYASQLRGHGDHEKALFVCLRGLSANPGCDRGRLILARVLYELRYVPFAVRELEDLLEKYPDSQSLQRLLNALSPESVSASKRGSAEKTSEVMESTEETVAETDFEIDDLDLLKE